MPWYGAKIQLQLDENVWLVMDDQKQARIQELFRQLQIDQELALLCSKLEMMN
jgi:hypothetical protein